VIVTGHDSRETVNQYAPYALRANGVLQPGGYIRAGSTTRGGPPGPPPRASGVDQLTVIALAGDGLLFAPVETLRRVDRNA
jgi:hypothetical protein